MTATAQTTLTAAEAFAALGRELPRRRVCKICREAAEARWRRSAALEGQVTAAVRTVMKRFT